MKIKDLIKKFKNNNSGVTLVELIVSVCILSIAIAPLLFTFVYSTRVNSQSKIKQRCLNSAMSIMETFKANGLERSYDLFSGNVTSTEADEDGNPVVVTTKFLTDNASASYTYPTGSYYGEYWIKDMTLSDTSVVSDSLTPGRDTKKYDVKIDITKDRVTTGLSEIDVFDPVQDVVFEEYDESYGSYYYDPKYVATEIVASKSIPSEDVSKVIINRTIDLNLTDSGATFIYSYHYNLYYEADTNGDGRKESTSLSGDYPDRSSAEAAGNRIGAVTTSEALRNVYFYYYPAYTEYTHNTSASGDTTYTLYNFNVKVNGDYLNINNTCSNDDVKLYIYKQADTSRTYIDLWASDGKYKLTLAPVSGSTSVTHVYDMVSSNLETIVNEHSTNPKSSFSMLQMVSGSDPSMLIVYDGKYHNGDTESVTLTEAALTSYVYISVYDPNKDPDHEDPICTLESTMLN